MGSLVFSAMVLLATVAVMVFVPSQQVVLEVVVMLAGLCLGALCSRFGVSRPWMGSVILVVFLAVWFALGAAGYAWFGGCLAGVWLGVAWGRASKARVVDVGDLWNVNGHGFRTVADARVAAIDALHALNGTTRGRLIVEHGSARFEAAGSAVSGLVCHRTAHMEQVDSWAVLSQAGTLENESVDVSMGSVRASLPSHVVQEAHPVEAALRDFLTNPEAEVVGREWMLGDDAAAMRLSS